MTQQKKGKAGLDNNSAFSIDDEFIGPNGDFKQRFIEEI